jgi:hypothetical protein
VGLRARRHQLVNKTLPNIRVLLNSTFKVYIFGGHWPVESSKFTTKDFFSVSLHTPAITSLGPSSGEALEIYSYVYGVFNKLEA